MKYYALLIVALLASDAASQTHKPPVRDGDRSFGRQVLTWNEIKFANVVMQQRDYSCGAASMATVLRYYWGKDVTELDVLKAFERSLRPAALKDRIENGLTMADMKVVADRMGYDAAVGKLDGVGKLRESKVPVIVTLQVEADLSHFVVYRGSAFGWVYLADPFLGNIRMCEHEFARKWIGNAVFVITLPEKTSSAVSRLGLRTEEILQARLNNQVVRRTLTPSAGRN
ncbi:MAG: C39 family peptidase [Pirellulaceae bacterium]